MISVAIAIGAFVSLLLLIQAGYTLYSNIYNPYVMRAQQRMRSCASRPLEAPSQDLLRRTLLSDVPFVHRLLDRWPQLRAIARLTEQANSTLPVGFFVLLGLMLGTAAFVFAGARAPWPMRVIAAAAGVALPFGYLYWRRFKRWEAFQRQFPDALDLVARALRAGHPFVVGMKMVSEEFKEPIGTEFDRTVEEIAFGIDVPTALRNQVYRVSLPDLKFFATAVILQRETGGNLATMVDTLAGLIRKRFELQGRVKALSAEGRLSIAILFGLPFVLATAVATINPGYFSVLFQDPVGQTMLTAGVTLLLVGLVISKRMVTIRV